MSHKGIGMKPNQAELKESFEQVLKNKEKYKKEFIEKELEQFQEANVVLIKNKFKQHKDKNEFNNESTINS